MFRCLLLTFLAITLTDAALAQSDQTVACRNIDHDGNRYSICTVDTGKADLRLFLNNDNDKLLGQFRAIDTMLEAENGKLAFAMNGGMYHANRSPVGYYVENGTEVMRVVPTPGPGNFGLLPNGVFCIGAGRADVFETLAFIARAPACDFASQSGPMLVIDGALHPRFLPDSTSRFIRNGVGTSIDGTRAVFAISRNPVTFHEFGRLFRDALNLPNALYFDGNISRLYAPELGRHDAGFPMGPVVGVVVGRTD